MKFFNREICVCAHLTQTRHAQKACAEMSGKYERDNRMEERKSGIEESERGGSFFGKQKFCTGHERRKVESACRKCCCEAKTEPPGFS